MHRPSKPALDPIGYTAFRHSLTSPLARPGVVVVRDIALAREIGGAAVVAMWEESHMGRQRALHAFLERFSDGGHDIGALDMVDAEVIDLAEVRATREGAKE